MNYFGMCVGGPLDGRMCTRNALAFQVPNKLAKIPEAPEYSGVDCSANDTITVTTYVHSPWRVPNSAPGETYDLWIPSDCTVAWAIERIYSRYRPPNKLVAITELEAAFAELDPFNQRGAVKHPDHDYTIGNDEASSIRLQKAIEKVGDMLTYKWAPVGDATPRH